MKMVKKLSLLAMVLTLASCNEKVSPELQQGNATTPDTSGGPTIVPDEYYFKVTNTAPLILNYRLHKSGSGNYNKACEIKGTTKLTNENYQAAPSTYDISCFMEAEELSLFYGGLSFQLESSANTCEYLAYSPHSYFNIQPGSSYGTYLKILKTSDDVTQAHIDSVSTAKGVDNTYTPRGAGAPVSLGADNYISETIVDAIRQPFTTVGIEDDKYLCRFNYEERNDQEGAPNCDEGQVTVRTLSVTYDKAAADALWTQIFSEYTTDYTDTTDDDGGGPDDGLASVSVAEDTARTNAADAARATILPTGTLDTKIVKCGGKVKNCVDGPIKKHSSLTGTRGILYTQTEFDKAGVTEKFEYPTLFPSKPNYTYANFRRDLANPFIAYGTTDITAPAYTGAFASATYGKSYLPNLIEKYAANKNWDNSQMISPALLTQYSTQFDQFTSTPLAADPFVGIGNQVNPFYTFYCLNAAYDIKARIRMVVRDWDRLSTNDASLEWISDVGTVAARQDVLPTDLEDPDSNDPLNYFNDKQDWDDIISMQRDPVFPYIFRPEPVSDLTIPGYDYGYPDGYFNPDYFPNWYEEE